MISFSQYLTEAIEMYYHASDHKITKFDLDHLGTGTNIDQEGPGIYLTNSLDDVRKYGKYIYHVRVKFAKSRMMPDKKRFGYDTIRRLISISPERDDALTNWDENPTRALDMAVRNILDSYGPDEYREAMEAVWGDFYRSSSKAFLSKMHVWGWDGFILPKSGGVKHFICFNPDILKIVKTEER